MSSWFHIPRLPQSDGGDPFLEVEAADSLAGRVWLDRRDDPFLSLLPEAPRQALVLGAGTGRLALKLAGSWPRCEVTGVDRDGAAVSEALEQVRRHGLVGRVWFAAGDACGSDLPEGFFDLVLCDGLLHHVPDPRLLLREAGRVVRPEGRIIMRDQERSRSRCWSWLGPEPAAPPPEPLAQAWALSAAAAYTLDELRDIAAESRLAGAAVRRDGAGGLLVSRGC